MAGWLQKVFTPPAVSQKINNLPALELKPQEKHQALPNATVIYGIGASLLFVASFFLMRTGRWFAALAVFALGICLVGFALHLLKHQD